MINLIFSNFIFLSVIYITQSSESIIFQLNYYYVQGNNNDPIPTTSELFSTIKIGDPQLNIRTYFSTAQPIFSMLELSSSKLNENELNTYYKISNSKTFQNIAAAPITAKIKNNDIQAKENFILNFYNHVTKKYNEKQLNELDFILAVGYNKDNIYEKLYYVNIGFLFFPSGIMTDRYHFGFIQQLKEKEIIDNGNWFIYFEKKNNKDEIMKLQDILNAKPSLIIGMTPHHYKNSIFLETQLDIISNDLSNLEINIKNCYLYTTDNEGNKKQELLYNINKVTINLNYINIVIHPIYMAKIKSQYFQKYMDLGLCHYINSKRYYCDKSDSFTLNDLKNFPSLYFESSSKSYIFELTYKDLFVENDGKYWFLISPGSNRDGLIIGYSFLKKFQLVINQLDKTLSFYNMPEIKEEVIDTEATIETDAPTTNIKNNTKDKNPEDVTNKTNINNKNNDTNFNNTIEDNSKKNSISTGIIVIIVVFGILFVVIIFLVVKLIIKHVIKRKTVNMLDQNYDNIVPYTAGNTN